MSELDVRQLGRALATVRGLAAGEQLGEPVIDRLELGEESRCFVDLPSDCIDLGFDQAAQLPTGDGALAASPDANE